MNELETQLSQIQHFQFVHEHLFTSGQPSAEQLAQIKAYGIITVINLALNSATTSLPNEDQLCLDLGLNYLQIPISLDTPSPDQCLLVLDLLDHLVQEQMLWIHCQNNQHVSSLMYVYRQYYMDMDMPTAQQLLHDIWQPNETWTGLIHAVTLQLQGRKATRELNLSLMKVDHFA
ncbi:protein tyrosine phosphatase family protein [Acinetobacter sp. B51(2017)]|uniref:protein tyrosine phosphatase family protein n=1 Tax=Acinetobacter sp. B51(2017) TaxID=2060938 RepID=UPI000F09407B|nr:protein tyrosine phosphatase family protein [Acinetobacter sp. B51(2017)]